jgi:hypothetical protein
MAGQAVIATCCAIVAARGRMLLNRMDGGRFHTGRAIAGVRR